MELEGLANYSVKEIRPGVIFYEKIQPVLEEEKPVVFCNSTDGLADLYESKEDIDKSLVALDDREEL